MTKIQLSYENDKEKLRIIEALSRGMKIKKISKPKKIGKYSKVYIIIE